MAYSHTGGKGVLYYLHTMMVKLRGSGKKQQIFYFSKKKGSGTLDEVPKGYKVITSRRTGLPLLKKGR